MESRSSKYQYRILEIPVSSEFFDQKETSSQEEQERLLIIDQLVELIEQTAKSHLTPNQLTIYNYHRQGLTQAEIAKKINVHQSSICKALYGNIGYVNKIARYQHQGGIFKKLKKKLLNDPKAKELLSQLSIIM